MRCRTTNKAHKMVNCGGKLVVVNLYCLLNITWREPTTGPTAGVCYYFYNFYTILLNDIKSPNCYACFKFSGTLTHARCFTIFTNTHTHTHAWTRCWDVRKFRECCVGERVTDNNKSLILRTRTSIFTVAQFRTSIVCVLVASFRCWGVGGWSVALHYIFSNWNCRNFLGVSLILECRTCDEQLMAVA